MDETEFHAFLAAARTGLKAEAACAGKAFVAVANAAPEPARRAWVYAHLETLDRIGAGRIRHEIFAGVLRPVLEADFRAGRLEAFVALARCEQNLHADVDGWASHGVVGALGLWRKAFDLAPDNDEVRAGLLKALVDSFGYTIHEWPSGLLLADGDPEVALAEMERDLALIRALDSEARYAGFRAEVEDMIRLTRGRQAGIRHPPRSMTSFPGAPRQTILFRIVLKQ